MKLTTDQVKKVAQLANLPISADEEEKYSQQLSKILDYIDQLNSVGTKNVDPTYNVTELENVMRADNVGRSLSQEEALQNAASGKNGFFVTKGIFGNE